MKLHRTIPVLRIGNMRKNTNLVRKLDISTFNEDGTPAILIYFTNISAL